MIFFSRPSFSLFLLFIIIFSQRQAALAQSPTVRLSGTVSSAESGERLPGASLSILGTTRGAKTNRDGRFLLLLRQNASVRIRIAAIGYRPDTLSFTGERDAEKHIRLASSPIGGDTVVVSASLSREEARRIMREVIRRKSLWQSKLHSYTFAVYSKIEISRAASDTLLQSIMETAAQGYWQASKGYSERIIGREQTANIPPQVNRFGIVRLINFYDDRIPVGDYSIAGPAAEDAFAYYDYDLLGKEQRNGSAVYKIALEPRGALRAAFEGTLYIEQEDFTLAGLSLHPNSAVKIPFVKSIGIDQEYQLAANEFWMPASTKLNLAIGAQLPIFPTVIVTQDAVLQDYVINTPIADSLFTVRRLVEPMADSLSPAAWERYRAIPLTTTESKAFVRLDSLFRAPAQAAEPGLNFRIAPNYIYNRVEASRPQLDLSFNDPYGLPITFEFSPAYDIVPKRFRYTAAAAIVIASEERDVARFTLSGDDFSAALDRQRFPSLTLSLSAFNDIERVGAGSILSANYPRIVNTAAAYLFKVDGSDYYSAVGFGVGLKGVIAKGLSASLALLSERDSSAPKITDRSLLNIKKVFRDNPAILNRRDNSITVQLRYEPLPVASPFSGAAEYRQSIAIGENDVKLGQIAVMLSYSIAEGGLGKTNISAIGGLTLSGTPGTQHLFAFPSRLAILAEAASFRTMSPMEFRGDRLGAIFLEHDFFDLPLRLVGLDPAPISPHFFAFGNLGASSIAESVTLKLPGDFRPVGSPYFEAGFGIGNVFDIMRIDAAWRVTHRTANNLFVTGSLHFGF